MMRLKADLRGLESSGVDRGPCASVPLTCNCTVTAGSTGVAVHPTHADMDPVISQAVFQLVPCNVEAIHPVWRTRRTSLQHASNMEVAVPSARV